VQTHEEIKRNGCTPHHFSPRTAKSFFRLEISEKVIEVQFDA